MALASDVYSELHKAKGSKVGIILLMFIGFSFIALGVFRTDAVVDPETFHGVIHHITAWIVGGLFPISCLVFAHIFKADSRWRSMYVYTIMAGTLGILLIAVWVIYQKNWFGLSERLLIWNGLVWFEVVAIHLEHISKHLP